MASLGTDTASQTIETGLPFFPTLETDFGGLWGSVASKLRGLFRIFFAGVEWFRGRAGTAGVLVLGDLGWVSVLVHVNQPKIKKSIWPCGTLVTAEPKVCSASRPDLRRGGGQPVPEVCINKTRELHSGFADRRSSL